MTKFRKNVITVAVGALFCAGIGAGTISCLPSVISHAEEFYEIVTIEGESYFEYSDIDMTIVSGFSSSYNANDYRVVQLKIPDGVRAILGNAFAGHSEIVSVTLPQTLDDDSVNPEVIGEGAFDGCTRLVEICNMSSLALTPYLNSETAFGGLLRYALNVYTVTQSDDGSEFGDGGSTLEVTQDGLLFCRSTMGEAYLVAYVDDLIDGNLVLPRYYYLDMNGTTLEYPYSVLSYAFYGDADLQSVEFEIGEELGALQTIGSYAFADCTNLQQVAFIDNVMDFGESVFEGCTALSDVILPENLMTLGSASFKDCVNLQSIKFPTWMDVIPSSAFEGCASLGTLALPTGLMRIDERAFAGCVNIDNLIFDEMGMSIDIGREAFRGCSSLTVLDFADYSISWIASGAFLDCENLSTVYIPRGAGFLANDNPEEELGYFDSEALLIFRDYSEYSIALDSALLGDNISQATYIVEINFNNVLSEGHYEGIDTWERLAGKSLQVVRNSDGTWAATEAEFLYPVQEGYAESAWYADTEFTTLMSLEMLDTFLMDAFPAEGYEPLIGIDLFALNIDKPSLTAKTLAYDEEISYTIADLSEILEGEVDNDYLTVAFQTVDGAPVDTIQNAGEYVVIVRLNEQYGVWEEDYTVTVTVDRKTIELSDSLRWWKGQVDGKNIILLDGNVYVYVNGDGDKIYSYSLLTTIPSGYVFNQALPVENSIARYRNADITLLLDDSIHEDYFTVSYPENNTERDVGLHEAQALLRANPNYLLRNSGGYESVTNLSNGVTIKVSQDGTQAQIIKSWYLVEVGNALYNAANPDEFYFISDWQYGEDVTIPTLRVGYSDSTTYQNLRFSLVWNETTTIGNEIQFVFFADYVNKSMPAGTYRLTFHVPSVSSEADSISYMAFSETFVFTVTPAAFESAWRTDIVENLVNADYLYNGSIQLYHRGDSALNLSIWNSALESSFNPERTGIWAQSSMDRYYSTQFELVYNINGMTSNTYYTYDELLDSRNLISPVEPGTYTVYYQFRAKNYESLTNESDDAARREYQFVILIYDEVVAPSLDAVEYTGSRIIPEVPQSPLYTIVYDNSETSYIDYGNYVITLTLNDPIHYKWVGAEGADYELNFEITRVKNSEALMLSVVQWSYGAYSDEANKPVWATQFVDNSDDSFYSYTLTSEDGKVYVYGSTEKGKGFGDAPYGVYTLTATAKGYDSKVAGSEGYGWLVFSQSIRIQVGKGVNVWTITPNVMQWRYGGYVAEVNLIFAEAQLSDANTPIYYSVTTDIEGLNFVEGLKDFTTENGVAQGSVAEALSLLTVGSYYLWASVAETEAFSAIPASPFEFRVTVANNYWEQAPSIVTWQQGDYDAEVNLIEALPHFGDTVQIVITVAGDPDTIVYDSAAEINNLSSAKAGVYELRATVAGTDDYEALSYSFNFSVFDKTGLPWWAVLLIVLAALGVLVLVFLILHVKGVLQLLSGKVLVAMRTKATVDATIAAVRANKVAANAKITVAQARGRELAEARAKAKASAPIEEPKEAQETQVEPAAEQAASGDTSDEEFFPTNPNDET